MHICVTIFSQHLMTTSCKTNSLLLGWDSLNLPSVNSVNNGHPCIRVMHSHFLVSILQACKVKLAQNFTSNISLIIRRQEPESFKSKEIKVVIT